MSLGKLYVPLAAIICLISLPTLARAENEGQDDLDQATIAKLEAKTLADLGKVVELCDSALKKGLNEGNTAFANELLVNSLTQRGTFYTKPILERKPPSPQWPQLRTLALADLERVAAIDPTLGDAQLLIAQLYALPNGDKAKAINAANAAVEAFDDDSNKLSEALTFRARMQDDPEKRLADFTAAIEADENNTEALRFRGIHYVERNEFEKGLADLKQVLERNSEDVLAHQAAAQALTSMKDYEGAIQHLNQSIDLNDANGNGYVLRARLLALQEKDDAAIKDLNKALEKNPRSLPALLMRAELRARKEQFELARGDVDRVLRIRPGLPQAIIMRSGIYAAQKKYSQAIADLEQLLARDETNVEIRLQIAAFLVADSRPRKAIEVYEAVLDDNPDDLLAMRGRADALLSIGKQQEAVEVYRKIIEVEPGDSGTLNNLAWVLATSPKDEVRDANEAIKLAEKACELTEFKAAHILSTLAAGHAEKGDFEKAIEWSKKAIEQGEGETLEALKKELESYQQKKPWRELQEVKEKAEPAPAQDDDLEL